jgi:hypothetical protein
VPSRKTAPEPMIAAMSVQRWVLFITRASPPSGQSRR